MNNRNNIINKIKHTILIVDDELINQEILKEILGDSYDTLIAGDGEEALEVVRSALKPISLILLDLNMPRMGGLEFIRAIKQEEKFRRIPIIVSTGEKESELSSLELGAVDFITKPYDMPEIILARVARSIELSEDRIIIQASERDELTGVYNKHIFVEYVQKVDRYRLGTEYDMVVLNIDKFHLFNELYGRDEGDRVLSALAEILMDISRRNDGIVGRLQSDYFALYITRQPDYNAVVQLIRQRMEQKYNVSSLSLRVGIYQVTAEESDPVDIRIDRATRMCDDIRGSNQNSFLIFDLERQKNVLFKERLIRDARRAVRERQFEVYYQPKINIRGERFQLSSAEALIRWNHPDFGFISPGVFIPIFEENGTIRILDRFVWEEAARQIRVWKDRYNRSIPVSVNVSRIDMFDSRIVDVLRDIVRENGIAPGEMYLEITESAYNNETDQILEIINQLKDSGFTIEIDDFGSGYSSLNTLASFSFDVLKLDMQFIREMHKNEKARKMIDIVAEIAGVLKVTLVAEGVETKEQCDALKQTGYDVVQGYYFSKPLCVRDFDAFIEKGEF
jgi:diguanylate cyclase (GGDEF)-like protein